MAVPKNKHRVRTPSNPNVFLWTGQRINAALLMAEGIKTHAEIYSLVGVHRETFWEWRKHPIFQAEVSRLTLANEKATRVGLLRIAYKAIEEKIGNIADDRSTVLEWTKFIANLQGYMKQKIEMDANTKHSGEIDLHKLTDDDLLELILNGSRNRKT